ncbi:hypothetical protein R1flu_003083 [Riccia fluitans]|uniref:Small auxin up regulated protein n=1 Tax=Riccia fluitans TaxID=41844 RepID=A0ABD1Y862_9MARC
MATGTFKVVKRIRGLQKDKLSTSRKRLLSPIADLEETHVASNTGRAGSHFKLRRSGVPHGCLAVYVGDERRRYVISTSSLGHPLFKELLKMSAEEFGFEYEGGLWIACDCNVFEKALWMITHKEHAARTTRLEDLIEILHHSF